MRLTAVSTSSHEIFGAPCWVSLLARDLGSAQRFYSAVLDWEFRATHLGHGIMVAFRDGAPVAGVGALGGSAGVPVVWTPYFAVDDADVTAARIRERGATMAVGPLAFGTGRAALAADPAGAVFGFWQGEVVPDWSVGRGAPRPGWNCGPVTPSQRPSSTGRSSTGAANGRPAARSPTSTPTSSCATVTTPSPASAAAPSKRHPTPKCGPVGTSTSGCRTSRARSRPPSVRAAGPPPPYRRPVRAGGSSSPIPRGRSSPWWRPRTRLPDRSAVHQARARCPRPRIAAHPAGGF